MKSVLPQLFVDQDGVLANLDAHYLHHFGKPAAHPGAFSAEEFWGAVNSVPGFWLTIPPFDGLREFWDAMVSLHGKPVILTTISSDRLAPDYIEEHKRRWVAQYLGPDVTVITCRGKDKRLHCRPGDILIDDWDHHAKSWLDAGGYFIHHRGEYGETLYHAQRRLFWEKTRADARTMFKAYDGSMMCEAHPGHEHQHDGCVGAGVPWILHGKTAILSALKERP